MSNSEETPAGRDGLSKHRSDRLRMASDILYQEMRNIDNDRSAGRIQLGEAYIEAKRLEDARRVIAHHVEAITTEKEGQ